MRRCSPLLWLSMLGLSSCLSSQVQEVAGYYHELGDLYYEQKKYDKAAELYQKSIVLQDNQKQVLYNLALIRIEQKHFADARRPLELFLQQDPANTQVLKALAYSYFQEGKYQQAERIYQDLYRQTPEDTKLLYNIGTILNLLGRYQQSQEMFARLEELTSASERDRAYALMVENFLQLGSFDKVRLYQERMVAGGQHQKENVAKLLALYRTARQDETAFLLLSLVAGQRTLSQEEAWQQVGFSLAGKQDFTASMELLNVLLDKEYQALTQAEQQLASQKEQLQAQEAKAEEAKAQGDTAQGSKAQEEQNKIKSSKAELKKSEDDLRSKKAALQKRLDELTPQLTEGKSRIDDLVRVKRAAFEKVLAKQAEERASKAAAAAKAASASGSGSAAPGQPAAPGQENAASAPPTSPPGQEQGKAQVNPERT